MNKFKAGDWVRDTRQGMKKPIAQLKPNCIALTNPEEYAAHYIPWVPEVGEWCWFWDDITPHRPTLRKFGCSELPKHYSDNVVFCDSEQNPFTNCEPFIGELPSFLKENK